MSVEELKGEREILQLSLEDLEREHDAGDLSDEDYGLLRDRYTARCAQVLRALEASGSASPGVTRNVSPGDKRSSSLGGTRNVSPGDKSDASLGDAHAGSREDSGKTSGEEQSPAAGSVEKHSRRGSGRRWSVGIVSALVVVLGVSVVLVTRVTSSRLPGQTVTGSLSLSRQQQIQRTLTQAQVLEAKGDAAQALELYDQVLQRDPTQEVALAESGWLEFEAGTQAKDAALLSRGQDDEQKAEAAHPSAFAPHLYLGSMLLVEGDLGGSVAQFRLFLADGPPSSVVSSAKPFIDRAFTGAGLAPPPLP